MMYNRNENKAFKEETDTQKKRRLKGRKCMEKEAIVWLGLIILFLVIELITVGLTSIWLAGGALAALILELAGLDLIWQIAAFLVISFVLLYFTRPFAVKYINAHHETTNYERVIGKVVKITETVDNLAQTGQAVYSGMEWTVRMKEEGVTLEKGKLGKVVDVSGVKLIVIPYEEE